MNRLQEDLKTMSIILSLTVIIVRRGHVTEEFEKVYCLNAFFDQEISTELERKIFMIIGFDSSSA